MGDLNLVHGFADDLLVLENEHPLAADLIARAFGVRAVPRG